MFYLFVKLWGWRGHRAGARKWRPAAGIVRVLAFALLVNAAFSVLCVRRVWGDIGRSAEQAGERLSELSQVLGERQALTLNGSVLYVGARHVELDVDAVLDRFEQHCQAHSGGFDVEMRSLSQAARASLGLEPRSGRGLGTARFQDSSGAGVIACVVAPAGSTGFTGLWQRIQAFAQSGDLSQIGHLRYAFARKTKGGTGADIVTIWNEGALNVSEMLFPEGDAPGRDNLEIPRPPESARVFDAEVDSKPYAVRSYESKRSRAELVAFYQAKLAALGWSRMPGQSDLAPELAEQTSVLTKRGAAVFLTIDDAPAGATVQTVELGAEPQPQAASKIR